MRSFLLTIVVSLGFVSNVRSQGLLYNLPEDSVFARFEMQSASREKGEERPKTYKGTLTISSVGEVKVDGKQCRWLEVKMEANTAGDHVVKVLVPVDRVKLGESPLDHAVKGWRKMIGDLNDGGLRELSEAADFTSNHAGIMPMLLPGVLADARKLPRKMIDSKLGKLECDGHAGTYTLEPGQDYKSKVTYETWVHDRAPFGVVACQITSKTYHNGDYLREFTMSLRLIEVGKGAKTELPDNRQQLFPEPQGASRGGGET